MFQHNNKQVATSYTSFFRSAEKAREAKVAVSLWHLHSRGCHCLSMKYISLIYISLIRSLSRRKYLIKLWIFRLFNVIYVVKTASCHITGYTIWYHNAKDNLFIALRFFTKWNLRIGSVRTSFSLTSLCGVRSQKLLDGFSWYLAWW